MPDLKNTFNKAKSLARKKLTGPDTTRENQNQTVAPPGTLTTNTAAAAPKANSISKNRKVNPEMDDEPASKLSASKNENKKISEGKNDIVGSEQETEAPDLRSGALEQNLTEIQNPDVNNESSSTNESSSQSPEEESPGPAPYKAGSRSQLVESLAACNPCICCCCCHWLCRCGLKYWSLMVAVLEGLTSFVTLLLAILLMKVGAVIFAVDGVSEGLDILSILKIMFTFRDEVPGSTQTVAGISAVQQFISALKLYKLLVAISGASGMIASIILAGVIIYDWCHSIATKIAKKDVWKLKQQVKVLNVLSILCWVNSGLMLLHTATMWWSFRTLYSIVNTLLEAVEKGVTRARGLLLDSTTVAVAMATTTSQLRAAASPRKVEAEDVKQMKATRDTVFTALTVLLVIVTVMEIYFTFCACILGCQYRVKLYVAREEFEKQDMETRFKEKLDEAAAPTITNAPSANISSANNDLKPAQRQRPAQ